MRAAREMKLEYVEFKEFMVYLGANVQQAQERGQAATKRRSYITQVVVSSWRN